MSIFKEHSVNGQSEAFLNWHFDDGNGRMDSDNVVQMCWDYKELGFAYLKGSAVILSSLLDSTNYDNEADTMIFPVLFDLWHGLELLLKSGNMMCDLYLGDPVSNYSKHKIDDYSDQFRSKMKRLGFRKLDSNQLKEMIEFIDDCKSRNANFDFARYTNKSNGTKQFYNTPDDQGYVQNVIVDLRELARVIISVTTNVKNVVDYLFDYMQTYGVENKGGFNEADLNHYCTQCINIFEDEEYEVDETVKFTVKDIIEKFNKKKTEGEGSSKGPSNE